MPFKMKMMLGDRATIQRPLQIKHSSTMKINNNPSTQIQSPNFNYSMINRLMGTRSGCSACGK